MISERDLFVRTTDSHPCDERWTSWPAIQESAVVGGNVLLFEIFPSVGNLFLTLAEMVQVIYVVYIHKCAA